MNRRRVLTFAALLPALPDGADASSGSASGETPGELTVKQFGAVGDGKVNDYVALQSAIMAAVAHKKNLFWPRGSYKTETTLLKPQDYFCPNFIAEAGTILDGSRIANGATLKIKGGSGRLAQARVEAFDFIGGTGADSTGLEIADQCGIDVNSCTFSAGTWGLTIHNENGFTEYTQAVGCNFSSSLSFGAFRYRVTGGTESFNGSGLVRCRVNMDGATAPNNAITIGDGALVYHAPFDFQVWIRGNKKTVINNTSSFSHLTHGTITIEVSNIKNYENAPELFGGLGAISCHQGHIVTFGTAWLGSKVILSGSFTKRVGSEGGAFNGTTAIERYKFGIMKNLDAGDTELRNIMDMGSCIAHVHISAPDYDYRYIIAAGIGVGGRKGTASIIATLSEFNLSGVGSPTMSVSESGGLIISNAKYGSGYVAYVLFIDLGPSLFNVGPSLADYKPS